jgi:hypothetical protein
VRIAWAETAAQNARMIIHGMATLRWLRPASETALGIVLALVPLALWIAWSPTLLVAVLATGAACAALLIAIAGPGRDAAAGDAQDEAEQVVVPDSLVEELHALFPLIYHHSRREKQGFRRTMEKLRRLTR